MSASTLVLAGTVLAGDLASPVSIAAEPLDRALQDLTRQTGVELLYDRSLVSQRRSPPMRGRLTAEAALKTLLAGVNLNVRRAASGALIIEPPAAAPLARQDAAVPEILVLGRKTQNADIRRLETDIQPYSVTTGERLVASDRDNIDQYFNSRVTSNAELTPPTLAGNGETNSEIDLRGLGSDQTLVLIDGRRLPGVPAAQSLDFRQPDLNAVPLYAVDRIETLTGTAGGIYGFGALGGVVNVVLAHNGPGVELHATGGISSRGDAERIALEGRFEFTPDDGATDLMLDLSFSHSQPLLEGERDFALRDREDTPAALFFFPPSGQSIGVSALGGGDLVLKPQYGGANLGSPITYLPAGFEGSAPQLAAALLAHAGQRDLSLSNDLAASDLTPDTRTGAVLANVRHSFAGGIEAYLDAVALWNRGRWIDYATGVGGQNVGFLFPGSAADPFQQLILVGFPPPPGKTEQEASFDTARITAGVVTPLPFDWRSTLEATLGEARYAFTNTELSYVNAQPPGESLLGPPLNPFGSWSQFQNAAMQYGTESGYANRIRNDYSDQSLRLAGPLFGTASGPATLTVLLEHEREGVPTYTETTSNHYGLAPSIAYASHSTSTTSAYAELRTKVFAEQAPMLMLRSLELQLAVRRDVQSNDFSRDLTDLDPSDRMQATFAGTTYTAGGKISPVRWLTLRGSYATGQTAPPLGDLVEVTQVNDFSNATDPRRGGAFLDQGGSFLLKDQGSPNLTTIRASTASFGAILTPFGETGPRFSLDYSHIKRTHDVEFFYDQLILDHEDYWPQRVVRAPLTAADKALGYTGGVITSIDASAINSAGRDVKTLDGRLEWSLPLPLGRLHLYGDATYRFHDVQTALFGPDVQLAGYFEQGLKWRANAGADWTVGSQSVGVNVQYFGSYSIESAPATDGLNDLVVMYQGSDTVPAQAYVDLHLSKRFQLHGPGLPRAFDTEIGVINLFDTAPPREASYVLSGFGYSRYGDPRQRRFQLSLSAMF